MTDYPYVWHWGRCAGCVRARTKQGCPPACHGIRPETGRRKGMRLRVLVRGGRNSRLVEFEDGHRSIVSGHGLRKVKGSQ